MNSHSPGTETVNDLGNLEGEEPGFSEFSTQSFQLAEGSPCINGGASLPVEVLPEHYTLSSYPNPFSTSTTIRYDLPHPVQVATTIFDSQGKQVRQMMAGPKPAGHHMILWDPGKDVGKTISAGFYFCKLETDEFSKVIKLFRVK